MDKVNKLRYGQEIDSGFLNKLVDAVNILIDNIGTNQNNAETVDEKIGVFETKFLELESKYSETLRRVPDFADLVKNYFSSYNNTFSVTDTVDENSPFAVNRDLKIFITNNMVNFVANHPDIEKAIVFEFKTVVENEEEVKINTVYIKYGDEWKVMAGNNSGQVGVATLPANFLAINNETYHWIINGVETDIPAVIEGPQGRQGIQGEKGEKGDKGDTGIQGPRGLTGNPGKTLAVDVIFSATETLSNPSSTYRSSDKFMGIKFYYADDPDSINQNISYKIIKITGDTYYPYFDGTVLKFTKNLNEALSFGQGVNIKGEKGDTGAQGPKGDQGEKGDKGDKGDPGNDGADGRDGTNGTNGQDGHTPAITIVDGYWYIDGVSTNVKAVGTDGTSISVKSNAAACTNVGDGYIDNNGHLQILTTAPSTFTDAGEIRGPKGDAGKSVTSITKTGTSGLVDTYTITYSDGTTSTFTVTNGAPGADGSNGYTPTIDPTTKHWLINGVDTGVKAEGTQGIQGPGGVSPTIDAQTGNWMIGETDTGVKAKGDKGNDGNKIFVSALNKNALLAVVDNASYSQDDRMVSADGAILSYDETNGWTDTGVSIKGTDAASLTSGSSAPSNSSGSNGDFYINTSTYILYKKVNGSWTQLFSMRGTDGATPTITGGFWYINGTNTGVRAQQSENEYNYGAITFTKSENLLRATGNYKYGPSNLADSDFDSVIQITNMTDRDELQLIFETTIGAGTSGYNIAQTSVAIPFKVLKDLSGTQKIYWFAKIFQWDSSTYGWVCDVKLVSGTTYKFRIAGDSNGGVALKTLKVIHR